MLLATWEAAYRLARWSPDLFPAPSHVIDAGTELLGGRTGFGEPLSERWPRPRADARPAAGSPFKSPLVLGNAVSLTRLVFGFSMSLVVGAIIGLLLWRFPLLDDVFGSVLLGLQTLPSVCWVPLAILTFSISETAILAVTVLGSCFAVAISLRDGLRAVPPVYGRAGRMLGASGLTLLVHVLIPASLPPLVSSLRQGFGFAWRSLLGGELLIYTQHQGLGYLLHFGRETGDVARVVAIMVMMVLIGTLADRYGFAKLERRVHRRFGLATT